MSPLPCGCYEGEECRECAGELDDAWIAELESRLVWEAAQ